LVINIDMEKKNIKQYQEDWWKYELVVNSDRGPLTVKWSDANELASWSNMQAGLYLQSSNSLQTFYEFFPKWYQMFWDARFKQGLFNIPDNSKILDIGCGVAVIDLLLAQYLPESQFYLLDKEGFNFYPGVYYDSNYPEYHNWGPVIDAIKTTNLDRQRFNILNPTEEWPNDLDVITSYLSYCWHYPKDIYWDKIINSLKIGGKLILDIRTLADRDIIGEITEDMKSEPVIHWFDIKLPAHIDNMPAPAPDTPVGGRFMWTRK
jgi:SAM-dependent methyltransferase